MIADDKLDLMREIYQKVYDETDNFTDDNIGADLAYLMGAVLTESYCFWVHDRPLFVLLRSCFSEDHEV